MAKETTKKTKMTKRPRVTSEQLMEMKKMDRAGYSLSAIARELGFHRQTVKLHLTEQKGDTISDEARGKILGESYKRHFENLTDNAQTPMKSMLDASPPEHEKQKTGGRHKGPISLSGLLGIPHRGGADYMSDEWIRMYHPPSRDEHLLRALREHTSNFQVWEPRDQWRKIVAEYETAGQAIVQHIETKLEYDLYGQIDPAKVDSIGRWLFGNILRLSINLEPEGIDSFRKSIFDHGATVLRDEEADADESRALYNQLMNSIVAEIKGMLEFETLKSSASELMSKEAQIQLRHVAKDIDRELAAIELMHALPGRCHLCPV